MTVATILLTLRIDLQRRLLLASECTTRSVEVWLPFLIAVYDALRFQRQQRPRRAHEDDNGDDDDDDDIDATTFDHLGQSLSSAFLSSRWRYLPTAFLLSLGCFLVAGLWTTSQSTYICPLLSTDINLVPRLQVLALFLDTALAIAVLELTLGGMLPSSPILETPTSWAVVLTLTSAIWSVVAIVCYSNQPENRGWLLLQHEHFPLRSLFLLLCQALFLTVLCMSTLYSVCFQFLQSVYQLTFEQVMNVGLLHVSTALTALMTMIPGLRFIWSARRPYPPISALNLTWAFVLIYFAWSMYSRIRRSIHTKESPPSTFRRFMIFTIFMVMIFPGLMKSNTVHFHPIDLLTYNAHNKHLKYLDYASKSKTLADAVKTYKERYQENPPPGFDKWWEFATKRSVRITDEFNQIYNDLFPFRAISPADLRQQTWEMVSNPWNEISGITIRGGIAKVQENVLPTHRWMLEGVVKMIEPFSEHLPDMDLAFNLNDESRVAVQYENLQALGGLASTLSFTKSASFSKDRAAGWPDIPKEPTTDTIFENWSFKNTFHEWAALTCPPNSPARRGLSPLFKSQLCLDCTADHSLGQFIADWSVAADPCHQPDLANLHGFYLSPSAFKATHKLSPVFSQSKAPGFNDVLYPSPWNYLDKVAYNPVNATGVPGSSLYLPGSPDPPFREKESLLYWRGATSEGFSTGLGTWRGMTRQRMVHLANNLTRSAHDGVTLLIPEPNRVDKYTYTTLLGSSLDSIGLNSSIRFVDNIVRCADPDCDAQATEFGLVEPHDFQKHWRYKYLVDLDGAGFSGRFLPFLQSHSLPFKSALFREWYDSRLVPWMHFVPLDLRLHGVWSTLAYFAGVHGVDEVGRTYDWKGHEREGELIAEYGREWAGEVLRKEDMEVYLFRLLLEWGRLTDDRRGELGFVMEG